jgi:glycerophosphoryl diester phosphodiesterase
MAHRGFSREGLENSMSAFQAAVDLGYRHLETDARVTSDGVALAFHDDILDRVTNDSGRVSALTAQQVAAARIRDREPIPLLEDVLATFGGCEINIDVKSDAAVGPTLDAIRRTNAWRRIRLASFSHRRIQLLRATAGPQVATALSPPEILDLKLSESALTRRRLGPPSIVTVRRGPDERRPAAQVPSGLGRVSLVEAGFIRRAHAAGIDVHVWTVNRRPEMIRLLELGVDGIITDRADVLREVLRERGQWNP